MSPDNLYEVVLEYPYFIEGMEVAAYLSDKVASVSCIDITAVPFERVLGEKVGKMLQAVRACSSGYIFCKLSLFSPSVDA